MKQDIEKLDKNFAPRQIEAGTQWIDIREFAIEGKAFSDTERHFDRWPARAKGVVPDAVWQLSRHSAGIAARFVTDANQISARWSLLHERLEMGHMPSTGVSGIDLYTRFEGRWRWLGIGVPSKFPTNEAALNAHTSPGKREMLMYLPLYNGADDVFVGIPEGATIEQPPAWTGIKAKPICFYGTSILHGGCASRPGLAYPAQISRALDHPHYNFGFSGNGRCEAEVARLLAELDPIAYLIDPLPNMTADVVTERMDTFLDILRDARPTTPIVLVENITYQSAYAIPVRYERYTAANAVLRDIFAKRVATGDKNLYLVPGDKLLGDDSEGTVDGTHPNDLGFYRMAQVIGEALRPFVQ